jgi:hypothetical protein
LFPFFKFDYNYISKESSIIGKLQFVHLVCHFKIALLVHKFALEVFSLAHPVNSQSNLNMLGVYLVFEDILIDFKTHEIEEIGVVSIQKVKKRNDVDVSFLFGLKNILICSEQVKLDILETNLTGVSFVPFNASFQMIDIVKLIRFFNSARVFNVHPFV